MGKTKAEHTHTHKRKKKNDTKKEAKKIFVVVIASLFKKDWLANEEIPHFNFSCTKKFFPAHMKKKKKGNNCD